MQIHFLILRLVGDVAPSNKLHTSDQGFVNYLT